MGRNIEVYASVIASAISDALVQSPNIEIGDIEWNRGPSLNYEVRRGIVNALKPDLYIEQAESESILRRAQDEYVLVEAVLKELRNNQPLFRRVESIQQSLRRPNCNATNFFGNCILSSQRKNLLLEIKRKLKPSLRRATRDSSPIVSDKAKDLLVQLDDTPRFKASQR